MRRFFGVVLIVIGVAWALLGVANVWLAAGHELSDAALGLTLLVNGALMLLPGLMLAGLGGLLARRDREPRP
jgi:hypothetical protein